MGSAGNVRASLVNSGMYEDCCSVDELVWSAFDDFAVVVDTYQVGLVHEAECLAKGVDPHGVYINGILG